MQDIDPEVLEFLKTLPPDVQQMLLEDWISKQSEMDTVDPNRPAIRTPGGDGSSYIRPRQEDMQHLPLLQAFTNQQQKRSKTIRHPDLY